jgi:hypothetical protein
MFKDMFIYARKKIAVYVNQSAALVAFEVKMFMTDIIIFYILVTRTCFPVKYITPYKPLCDKFIKTAVNSCSSHGSTLTGEEYFNFTYIDVSVLTAYEEIKYIFFLTGFIS